MVNFLLQIFSLSYILRNIKFHVFLASVIIQGLRNKKSSLFLQHILTPTQNIETVKVNILNTQFLRICYIVLTRKIKCLRQFGQSRQAAQIKCK
jgi:hypothetical protein